MDQLFTATQIKDKYQDTEYHELIIFRVPNFKTNSVVASE